MERTQRIQALFEQYQDFFVRLTINHHQMITWLREVGLLPSEWTCCNETCDWKK